MQRPELDYFHGKISTLLHQKTGNDNTALNEGFTAVLLQASTS